jgi:hypothetical protein
MVYKNNACFYELNLKQKVYSAEYVTFEIQFQSLSLNEKRELGVLFVSDLHLFLPVSVMLSQDRQKVCS